MQFSYLQLMNINFKTLFVYSYSYLIFLYAYVISCKILSFSITIKLMYFELSGSKQEFSNYKILDFLHKKDVVSKKYSA